MDVDADTTSVGDSPIFYYGAPSGGTPVVYVHGVPTSADDWLPFLQRSGGIAPDLPGFGRSGKAEHLDISISGHADFLERFLADRGIDQIKLVAHDWGAAGALTLAQRDPARIERLVLINPVPLLSGFSWHRPARLLRTRVLGELAIGSVTRGLLARALRRGSAAIGAWPDERLAAVWEQFDQGTQRAVLRLYRDGDPARLEAAGAELDQLTSPALIIWGQQDPWLGPALAGRYAERLPHAEVELIDRAGHWPWLDRPDVIERVAAYVA